MIKITTTITHIKSLGIEKISREELYKEAFKIARELSKQYNYLLDRYYCVDKVIMNRKDYVILCLAQMFRYVFFDDYAKRMLSAPPQTGGFYYEPSIEDLEEEEDAVKKINQTGTIFVTPEPLPPKSKIFPFSFFGMIADFEVIIDDSKDTPYLVGSAEDEIFKRPYLK